MSNRIEKGISIQTENDVHENLRGTTEKAFALFLLRIKAINPCLEIQYEPQLFEHINGDGKSEGTLPDFFVRNTANPSSRGTYIEITNANANGILKKNGEQEQEDPKRKQKRVMKLVASDKRYVVLYRENLERIQNALPYVKRGNYAGIIFLQNRNVKKR